MPGAAIVRREAERPAPWPHRPRLRPSSALVSPRSALSPAIPGSWGPGADVDASHEVRMMSACEVSGALSRTEQERRLPSIPIGLARRRTDIPRHISHGLHQRTVHYAVNFDDASTDSRAGV